MKFKTISSALFSLFLVACTARPVAPTSTYTPPITPTSISNATPAVEIDASKLTPTPVVIESDLNWEYIELHRLPLPETLEINNIKMKVGFGFDQSIQNTIKKSQLHKNWVSDAGNTAEFAPAMFVQRTYYDIYVSNQLKLSVEQESIASFDTWSGWVSEAQSSGKPEDYSKFAIDVVVNDLTTDFKLEKVRVVPMFLPGGELPPGTRPISGVDLIVVRGGIVKNIEVIDKNFRGGIGCNLSPDGKLIIYYGPLNINENFSSQQITALMSMTATSLERGQFGVSNSAVDKDLLEIIANKNGQDYSVFFQIIDPASEVELKSNR